MIISVATDVFPICLYYRSKFNIMYVPWAMIYNESFSNPYYLVFTCVNLKWLFVPYLSLQSFVVGVEGVEVFFERTYLSHDISL